MFFDWAAQPFFTVVTTFIFGPYFVSRLTDDPVSAQTTWSNMATISSVIIALLSPVLGSIADQSGARKPWIGFFAIIKIASLSCLWFAAPGSPVVYPVIFMILASISAEFSIVFNDSMMPRLVGKHEVGKLSNTAWGLGYLGGIIVLIAVVTLWRRARRAARPSSASIRYSVSILRPVRMHASPGRSQPSGI